MSAPFATVQHVPIAPDQIALNESTEARDDYTDEAVLAILALYATWAKSIARRESRYSRLYSDNITLREQAYRQLERELIAEHRELTLQAEALIEQAMQDTEAAIEEETNRMLTALGIAGAGIAGAHIASRIATGAAYGSTWNLTQSLWDNHTDTSRTIQQIIAGARAQNLPPGETARLLAQYASGNAKQHTFLGANGSRLYPKQAGYSITRLARTLINHVYQASLFSLFETTPYIVGYMWIAAGSHPCPACLAKDGTIYRTYTWDFDHPNGQCIMRPIMSNEVSRGTIAAWNSQVPLAQRTG